MHEQLQYTFATPRTKAISFHPFKPVILSAHHTSVILSHDLHLNKHTYTFKGHDGPVRAIMFHPRTEIFVSGGDDAKVILWSFSSKKQLHVFKGHTDYIRSIDFHPTNPWIISSSDDQTIRIWNFQSYKCIATISGHSHYVMSCRFVNNAIISVSLDQSIRLWDYSSLLKKNEKSIIGIPSVYVKQIIEGHDRGINWIEKHPTKNIVATGGDDRQVKIWEIDEVLIEKESYYSHSGNVTGITFIEDSILSTGEDGILSIEGKKESKKIMDDTRMWCIAKNNDCSLFAIGYDTGIKVYSTKRKGIAYNLLSKNIIRKEYEDKEHVTRKIDGVIYCLNDTVYKNDLENEIQLCKPRKECISLHMHDKKVLVQYISSWEIFEEKKSVNKGQGLCIFVGGKIVNVEKNVIFVNGKEVYECNETITKIKEVNSSLLNKNGDVQLSTSFYIFTNAYVNLFDITKNTILYTIKLKEIEKIVHGDFLIAFMSKRKIYILSQNYNVLHTFEEMVEINDAFFDGNTLFYSTMRHIKYILNDYKGILRSIEKEVYLLFRKSDYFFYMTQEGIENVRIDMSEYEFRKAVNENNKNEIERIIQERKLCGTAVFDYLAKKGKGDSILEYVDIEKRIEILIESGKYSEAYQAIGNNQVDNYGKNNKHVADTSFFYDLLFKKCMKNNVVDISEKCLLKINDYNKLFIFYICTKQKDKIEKLKKCGNEDFKLSLGIFLNDTDYLKSIIYSKGTFQLEEGNYENKDCSDDKLKRNKDEDFSDDKVKENENKDEDFSDDKVKENENKDEENVYTTINNENEEYIDKNENDSSKCEYTAVNVNTNNTMIDNESAQSHSDQGEQNESDYNIDSSSIDYNNEQNVNDEKSYTDNVSLIYDKNSFDEKDFEQINDIETKFDEAMNLVTFGKFKTAILLLKNILYTVLKKYEQSNSKECFDEFSNQMINREMVKNVNFNKLIGFYLSGLILEKEKKKIDKKDALLNISYYFANLELLENHKTLAKTNLMIVCYKNGRYEDAKKIGNEIKDLVDENVKKMIGKIMKNNKKNEENTKSFEGDFCFDTIDFCKETKICCVCRVRSMNGDICGCCEVGYLL